MGGSLHLSDSRPSPLSRKVLSLAGVWGPFPSSPPLSRERGAVCSPRAPSGRPTNGQSPAGGGEGPRPAPCRAGGLYKAVTPRTGQGPGSPALYESPHGSAKSFTLGWFAEAPLHPSGLIRPGPPAQGILGAKEALGPSRGDQGRERRGPRSELTAPSSVPGVVPEPKVQRTPDETAECPGRPETRLLPESEAHASAGRSLGRVGDVRVYSVYLLRR